MNPHIYITYDIIFDDEPMEIHQYLKSIDRNVLIKFALLLIQSNGKYEKLGDYISAFFCKQNANFAQIILNNFNKSVAKHNPQERIIPHSYIIASESTGLELLRQVFSTNNYDAHQSPVLQEQNLFKAILLLNTRLSKMEIKEEYTQNGDLTELFYAKSLLLNSLNNYENLNLKDEYLTLIQVIKGFYFFKFCENSKLKEHLKLFLKKRGLPSWEQYLYNAIKLLLFPLKNKKGYSTILINHDNEGYSFLHSHAFSINSIISLESNKDYTFFKSHPLIEVDANTFLPINALFCINHLYRSIYFEFRAANEQLKGTPSYINGRGLRTVITTEFSEQYMFDKFISRIFKRQNGIKLSDNDCKRIARIGHEPDFYFRSGNNILLFENKDIMISADTKRSGKYDEIETTINEKLIKKAGICQLIHHIRNIDNKSFIWDKQLPKHPRVYPIIVLDDSSLCVPGLNYILNAAFEEQLKANKIQIKVYPLVVIELDTLIAFVNDFEKGLYKLRDVLDRYYTFQNKTDKHVPPAHILREVFKKYFPFYHFFSTEFAHKPFDDDLFNEICNILRRAINEAEQ